MILRSVGGDDNFVARDLADAGKQFIAAKGTTATMAKSIEGELPEGLKAIKPRRAGPNVETAWISDPFLRPAAILKGG